MKYYVAQAYGEGSYGEGLYACTAQQQADGTCAAAAGAAGNGQGGGLADTGLAVVVIITLASLIIFAALIVRLWRRKPALQEVPIEEPEVTPTDRSEQR